VFRRAQLLYLLKESFAGFRRRKLTTGVTILIMGAAVLVLALFTIVTINLSVLLEQARSGIDLRVFLTQELTPEAQARLQPELVAIPGVRSVVYITKEAALAQFRAELGDEAPLLDVLDSNPLPASYHVTLMPDARDSETVGSISETILRWPEVSDVIFNRVWVEVLETWNQRFQLASLIVCLVVLIAAVSVISNTVRLTIAASARIIEIMKLVGASNGFIRVPFLCEGMLEGLLGGALAMAVLGGTRYLLGAKVGEVVFFTPVQIAGFIFMCVALGLIGSWAALRKYLRMQAG